MYKAILTAAVALAIYVAPTTSAAARPTSTTAEQTQVKKKPVKKKAKKKVNRQTVAAVQPAPAPVVQYDENTAHGYWLAERARNEALASITPKQLTTDDKRRLIAKNCNMFNCGQASKVVAEAKKWEGKHARSNRAELANLMRDGNNQQPVDPVRIPWCAGFVNAILARTGHETTESLQARSFLSWGAKTKDPKEGDIVVLTRGKSKYAGHVGFFQGYEWYGSELYVKVLGGNQNKAVNVAYFPARKVLGYRTAQS
jgi:uncharacterized protein (TIGR02594 family)